MDKVREWLEKRANAQFEVLETRPMNPGVIREGKDYYIDKVKRLKDGKEYVRLLILFRDSNDSNLIINGVEVSLVCISKFHYDLANVDITINFRPRNIKHEVITIEINEIENAVRIAQERLKGKKFKEVELK